MIVKLKEKNLKNAKELSNAFPFFFFVSIGIIQQKKFYFIIGVIE